MALRIVLIRPLDRWLTDKKDEDLRGAARAIYNFPLVYTVFYSLMFVAMYVALGFLVSQGYTDVGLGEQGLVPILFFAATVGFGSFAVGFPLNLFLFAPTAGRISIPAHKRGEELPGVWFSIRAKIVWLALCLAATPASFFLGIQTYLNSSTHLMQAQEMARSIEYDLAIHPENLKSWEGLAPVYPFLVDSQGQVREGTKLRQLLERRPELRTLFINALTQDEWTHVSHFVAVQSSRRGEGRIGVLVTASTDNGHYDRVFWGAGLLTLLFSLLSAALMGHTVANPVAHIAGTVGRIVERGEVDPEDRSPVFFQDEVGNLARDSNRMIERLSSTISWTSSGSRPVASRSLQERSTVSVWPANFPRL